MRTYKTYYIFTIICLLSFYLSMSFLYDMNLFSRWTIQIWNGIPDWVALINKALSGEFYYGIPSFLKGFYLFFWVKIWSFIFLKAFLIILFFMLILLRREIKFNLTLFLLFFLFVEKWFIFSNEIDKTWIIAMEFVSFVIALELYFLNRRYYYLFLSCVLFLLWCFSYPIFTIFSFFYFICIALGFVKKINLNRRNIAFIVATILILPAFVYFTSHEARHALSWILVALSRSDTDFSFQKILTNIFFASIPVFIIFISHIKTWFLSSQVINRRLLFFIFFWLFIFWTSSESYSAGSRYPFYFYLFIVFYCSFLPNISSKKELILIYFYVLISLFPLRLYERWLWNSQYKLCQFIETSWISGKNIAYLQWPSIDYHCSISNGVDSFNNTYTNYWWQSIFLDEVSYWIQECRYDYVIVDNSGADYIFSSKRIWDVLLSNRRYTLIETISQEDSLTWSRKKKILIYKKK